MLFLLHYRPNHWGRDSWGTPSRNHSGLYRAKTNGWSLWWCPYWPSPLISTMTPSRRRKSLLKSRITRPVNQRNFPCITMTYHQPHYRSCPLSFTITQMKIVVLTLRFPKLLWICQITLHALQTHYLYLPVPNVPNDYSADSRTLKFEISEIQIILC